MKSDAGQAGRQRRQHDRAFKAKVIQQCLAPGASVSAIALENGINANMLFKWRREELRHASTGGTAPMLLPVRIAAEPAERRAPRMQARDSEGRSPSSSVIELEFAGAKLRLRGGVHEDNLRKVLRALRETA